MLRHYGVTLRLEPSAQLLRSECKSAEFLGRVPRVPPAAKAEFVDDEFLRFAAARGFAVPSDLYRMSKFDTVASYNEFSKFLIERPSAESFSDVSVIADAMEMMRQHFGFYMRSTRILSFEEAAARVPRDTSCGAFLNDRFPHKGALFASGTAYKEYEDVVSTWDTDYPMPQFFLNVQKGELRKVGKATRGILPGPFAMHMFQVMMFAEQNDQLVRNHSRTFFGCGVSPFHGGWNHLWQRLRAFGGSEAVFISSDVSGWDRSVPAWLRWQIANLRFQWLPLPMQTQRNLRRVMTAYDLCINAYVVLEHGDVVRKHGGTSSGEYLTLDDNCLIHCFVLFLVLRRSHPKLTYAQVVLTILCSFVGDDNVGVVRKDMLVKHCPGWSWDAFKKGYNDLGFTLKVINVTQNLLDHEFLSMKWQLVNGIMMARPDRQKVLCALAYGNRYGDPSYRFARACAYRMYTYPDPVVFRLITEWVDELMRRYEHVIHTETGAFPWAQIRGQWKSDAEILVLHSSYEARDT